MMMKAVISLGILVNDLCEQWVENVKDSLDKIERRKDNREIIDHPLRMILNDCGIDDLCNALESDSELRRIYFT